ncbi:hypothetical protein K438DRAFT_2033274 [Mycena galopus ATCC 62051]|nr:hypothetical protein K438DRAFT_2033274 [Mycena galopus ATCC 62051]
MPIVEPCKGFPELEVHMDYVQKLMKVLKSSMQTIMIITYTIRAFPIAQLWQAQDNSLPQPVVCKHWHISSMQIPPLANTVHKIADHSAMLVLHLYAAWERPDELTIEEKYKVLEKDYSGLVRNHGELHGRFVDLAADIKEIAAEYSTIFEEYNHIVEEHEGLTIEHKKLKVKYNKLLTLYKWTSHRCHVNGQTNHLDAPIPLVWPIWTTLVSDMPEQHCQSAMDKPCTCDPARWLK